MMPVLPQSAGTYQKLGRAVESGQGEEFSALRRLIILLLARNLMPDRQVFMRQNFALC